MQVSPLQINVSRISGGGGVAGALFALICTLVFLIGVPALRLFLPAAILLGFAVALVIHLIGRRMTGAPWILPATKK